MKRYRRRRLVNGVMTLRLRLKTCYKFDTTGGKCKKGSTAAVVPMESPTHVPPFIPPSRRSQRTATTLTPVVPKTTIVQWTNGYSQWNQKQHFDNNGRDRKRLAGASFATHDPVAVENRILFRNLESFGPNYEYISKTVLPIHHGSMTSPAMNGSSHLDASQLEQRCRKQWRKQEKWMAKKQADVLSSCKYFLNYRFKISISNMFNTCK
jgi:hypothetical protein